MKIAHGNQYTPLSILPDAFLARYILHFLNSQSFANVISGTAVKYLLFLTLFSTRNLISRS